MQCLLQFRLAYNLSFLTYMYTCMCTPTVLRRYTGITIYVIFLQMYIPEWYNREGHVLYDIHLEAYPGAHCMDSRYVVEVNVND